MARKHRRKSAPQEPDPRWRSPAPPAPGELRIVQAFLSTAPAWRKREELVDSETLAAWLELWELVPKGTDIRREQVRRMLAVRESLRAMVRARDGKAAPEAVKTLDKEARKALAHVQFDAGGGIRYRIAVDGFEGALARMFEAVHSAQKDGSWKLLKLCADPKCGRAFYDYSTNRRGKWCQPQCGYRRSTADHKRRRTRRYFA